MVEQYYGDLTGDDIPEWVVAYGGLGGNHMNHGWLYVLQWQDGELVDIAPSLPPADNFDELMMYEAPAGGGSPLFPYGVSVDIQDVDNNNTTEIIIYHDYRDTWNCEFAPQEIVLTRK